VWRARGHGGLQGCRVNASREPSNDQHFSSTDHSHSPPLTTTIASAAHIRLAIQLFLSLHLSTPFLFTGLSCSRDGSIDFLLAASRAFMRSYALPSSISSSSSRPGDGDFGDMARAGALCVSSSEADALFSDSVSLSEESAADLRRAAKSLGRGLDASVERDNGVERDDCGDVLDILNGHSRRNCITSCILLRSFDRGRSQM
jgi:hypothetical protein